MPYTLLQHSFHSLRFFVCLAMLTLLSACGGGGGSSSTKLDGEGVNIGAATGPNYYGDAKDIIDRHCTTCHRDGGLAPFSMIDYDQLVAKRSALIHVLESGTMPPQGYAAPADRDVALLLEWLNKGAPMGDPADADKTATNLSYFRDTKSVIDEKCGNCHTPGGVAPFSLTTYDEVNAVKLAAAHELRKNTMPPWPPSHGYTELAAPRALTAEDKHLLLAWLEGDAAAGNPADEVTRSAAQTTIDYDLTIQLPQPFTPTRRPDDYRCFVADWPVTDTRYVTAVQIDPDVDAEVHHVIVSIVEPARVAAYKAAEGTDGLAGFACFGGSSPPGEARPQQLAAWAPGSIDKGLPVGTGIKINPGSALVIQMHYNTIASDPVPDQSSIKLRTATQVAREGASFLLTNPRWLRAGGMPIPALDGSVTHSTRMSAGLYLPFVASQIGMKATDTVVAHGAALHMHTLGQSETLSLVRPDGTRQVLLDIQDWDFGWQGSYKFTEEITINPADTFELSCTWDNSASNQQIINGTQLQSINVEWGEGTTDEMCLFGMYITYPPAGANPDELNSHKPGVYLHEPAYRQQFKAGDTVPLKIRLNNFALHEPGTAPASASETDEIYRGHYAVYLNSGTDEDVHLEGWDENYFYQLPDNIAAGIHVLHIALRGDDERDLGYEHSVEIEVVGNAASAAKSQDLIDANAWQMQTQADDSLAAHRPASINCPDNAWYNEDGALEVETGYCNYLSLSQPSLAAISADDTIHLTLWHGQLRFDAPATAHVAISIDGKLLWQSDVAIPGNAEIFDLRLPAGITAPAGAKVEFHLHNHGYNTWTLLNLDVEQAP